MTNAPILTHLRNQTQLTSLPGDERNGGTHKRKASAATCAAAVNADSWMDDDDDQQQQQQQQHNVASAPANRPVKQKHGAFDVVLSSGFLAFANHAGFLQAVEDAGLDVRGVMGTSAGALSGSLYAAGYAPHEVAAELSRVAPIQLLGPGVPWKGALSMSRVVERLRVVLPATFEELGKPLGVGVYDRATGEPRLVTSGDLPRAVAASCAVPGLFAPVRLGGALYLDGGAVDRTFLALHKAWRPERRAVCHLVKNDGVELVQRDGIIDGVYVVKTPRANAKLWGLGDFEGERKAAEELSKRSLAALANLDRIILNK